MTGARSPGLAATARSQAAARRSTRTFSLRQVARSSAPGAAVDRAAATTDARASLIACFIVDSRDPERTSFSTVTELSHGSASGPGAGARIEAPGKKWSLRVARRLQGACRGGE